MTETQLRNVECPSCGGTLVSAGHTRQTNCAYCGGAFFIDELAENRYWLPPKFDRRDAGERLRQEVKRALADPHLGQDAFVPDRRFTLGTRLVGLDLYFVPFFRYNAFEVGTSPTQFEDKTGANTELIDRGENSYNVNTTLQIQHKIESKVALAEVNLVLSGLDLSPDRTRQWGLNQLLTEANFLSGKLSPPVPFDQASMERLGTILQPFRSAAEVQALGRRNFARHRKKTRRELGAQTGEDFKDQPGSPRPDSAGQAGYYGVRHSYTMDYDEIDYSIDIVDDRVSVYFYPVWKADLGYKGKRYEAYLDALQGKLISLVVPSLGGPRLLRPILKPLIYGQLLGWIAYILKENSLEKRYWPVMGFAFLGVLWDLYREWPALRQLFQPRPAMEVVYFESLET